MGGGRGVGGKQVNTDTDSQSDGDCGSPFLFLYLHSPAEDCQRCISMLEWSLHWSDIDRLTLAESGCSAPGMPGPEDRSR